VTQHDGSRRLRTTFAGEKFRSRSHDAVIRVYDEAGNVIETHEQAGDFKRVVKCGLAVLQCFNANCLYAARNRLQNAV
jgi:hypothetical protein